MRSSVGQYWVEYAFHVAIAESRATGQVTPRRLTAALTFTGTFSKSNSGEWIPTMTNPRPRYALYSCRRWGMVRTQLTHENVQKSTSTTRPRRPASVRGGLLIQPSIPAKSGAATRSLAGSSVDPEPAERTGLPNGRNTASAIAANATAATTMRPARYRFIVLSTYLQKSAHAGNTSPGLSGVRRLDVDE